MIAACKQPSWRITRTMRARARLLRREGTEAERIIWNAVRAHRLNGSSFRRQTPVGPYIVDFLCHDAKLIIELDGGQHFEAKQQRYDARRDAFLQREGYRVLRFNNYDLMTNRRGVLETIAAALENALSPTLPRKRGRESRRAREDSAK